MGTGSGFPAIYNEEVGLKMLMKKGVPLEKAWDWSCIGCVEPLMPGKTSQWSSAGHYNLAAAVEFVLTNGVHRKSGKRIGLETGDPETFASYEMFKRRVCPARSAHPAIFHLPRTSSSGCNSSSSPTRSFP